MNTRIASRRLLPCLLPCLLLLALRPSCPGDAASVNEALRSIVRIEAGVVEVEDGRSALMEVQGKKERVLLLGMETHPLQVTPKARFEARRAGKDIQRMLLMGELARRQLQSLLIAGDTVFLELDTEARNRIGVLQAYVHTKEGLFVNLKMIEDGFARPSFSAPNLRHQEKLEKAFAELVAQGRGFYAKENP